MNVVWYGVSGNDKGRDILCERNELWRPTMIKYKCVVQCKRYSGAIAFSVLNEDILKAAQHKPEIFIIAITGVLSASTKDWLSSSEKREGMKIVLWERTDIEKLLEDHPDLLSRYFDAEYKPDFLLRQMKFMTHARQDFDCVLLTSTCRAVLSDACQNALTAGTCVTTIHLLAALLKLDTLVTRPVFEGCKGVVIKIVERLLRAVEPRSVPASALEIGLTPSIGFRLTLEHAFALRAILPDNGLVSTRAILIATLRQDQSESIKFLKDVLGEKALNVLISTAEDYGFENRRRLHQSKNDLVFAYHIEETKFAKKPNEHATILRKRRRSDFHRSPPPDKKRAGPSPN